jgi:hypothetical protein
VPATKVREVSHMLKAIHAQESRDAAERKARAIVDDLNAARMNTAADLVERSVSETLTYYAFPDIHWQKIRTTDEMDKRFYVRRGIFFLRGRPRGEARRDGWKRRQVPHSCLAGLRRSRTPSLGDLVFHRATKRA